MIFLGFVELLTLLKQPTKRMNEVDSLLVAQQPFHILLIVKIHGMFGVRHNPQFPQIVCNP